jgi:hypothetical protein
MESDYPKFIVWILMPIPDGDAWFRHDKTSPSEVLNFIHGLRVGIPFIITIRSSLEEIEKLI